MVEALDQIFVTLKHQVVGFFPDAWRPFVSALVSISFIPLVFATLFAFVTVIERKGIGRIQNRYGPNRVGIPLTKIRLCGFGQFIPDGIKSLTKEDVVPRAADKVVHFLAPVVLLIPVLLAYAVLPIGRNMTAVDFDAGLLFFFAVGGAVELSVFMAGWSSHNKYSLLGAMRAIAQMISYEIPLILSAVTVIMIVGSLKLADIVAAQNDYSYGLAHWFVFTPWGLAGFTLFFIASLAESNRSPFDLPEAESEIIAGYYTEYSGFKFALFFLGEYLGMFAVIGLYHTVLGRLDRAVFIPHLGAVVSLVLRQADGAGLRFYLDSRHAVAVAHGPAHELCLEIHAAAVAGEHRHDGRLAFHRPWPAALGGLLGHDFRFVCHPRPGVDAKPKTRQTHLPLRGMKNVNYNLFFLAADVRRLKYPWITSFRWSLLMSAATA